MAVYKRGASTRLTRRVFDSISTARSRRGRPSGLRLPAPAPMTACRVRVPQVRIPQPSCQACGLHRRAVRADHGPRVPRETPRRPGRAERPEKLLRREMLGETHGLKNGETYWLKTRAGGSRFGQRVSGVDARLRINDSRAYPRGTTLIVWQRGSDMVAPECFRARLQRRKPTT